MVVYTGSYFQSQNHHGKVISISHSEPRKIKVNGKLAFLAPSKEILNAFKQKKIDEEGYVAMYRALMAQRWKTIKAWLDSLDPEENITLCCWEKAGDFCHRNLAIKFVERYRTDCFGGCDVPNK